MNGIIGANENLIQKGSARTYLERLLDGALSRGLITQSDILRIQRDIINLLGDVILEYTCGESSSVSNEIASGLAAGILHHIGTYLMSFSSDKTAIAKLNTTPLSEMRLEGIRLEKKQVATAVGMIVKLRGEFVNIPGANELSFLPTAIYKSLETFDYKHFPTMTRRLFDYPTANKTKLSSLYGSEYYINYISSLTCENDFLSSYPGEELAFIFKYHPESRMKQRYGDNSTKENKICSFFNIYTAALHNAVFCRYLRKDEATLALTKDDCAFIYDMFADHDDAKCTDALRKSCEGLLCGRPDYNRKALELSLKSLLSAVRSGRLHSFISVKG